MRTRRIVLAAGAAAVGLGVLGSVVPRSSGRQGRTESSPAEPTTTTEAVTDGPVGLRDRPGAAPGPRAAGPAYPVRYSASAASAPRVPRTQPVKKWEIPLSAFSNERGSEYWTSTDAGLYVTVGARLTRVDPATGAVVWRRDLTTGSVYLHHAYPGWLGVASGGSSASLDPATGTTRWQGSFLWAVGARAAVVRTPDLVVLDPSAGKPSTDYPIRSHYGVFCFLPDGGVVVRESNELLWYVAGSWQIQTRTPLDETPDRLLPHPDGVIGWSDTSISLHDRSRRLWRAEGIGRPMVSVLRNGDVLLAYNRLALVLHRGSGAVRRSFSYESGVLVADVGGSLLATHGKGSGEYALIDLETGQRVPVDGSARHGTDGVHVAVDAGNVTARDAFGQGSLWAISTGGDEWPTIDLTHGLLLTSSRSTITGWT